LSLTSMTGYGRASSARGALTADAEARSVNGRFCQVRCRLPSDLMRLEPRMDALVRKAVTRGTVDVHVRVRSGKEKTLPRVNTRVLTVYRDALEKIGGGDAAALLSLPGVISTSEDEPSERTLDSVVMVAVRGALDKMTKARVAEGKRLRTAIRRELTALRRHLGVIRRLAPASVKASHAAMRKRVDALLTGSTLPADDPGLLREMALLADKRDITEEIDRLDSHLVALAEALDDEGAVGRQLDFLLQEIGREVNTIGSKANDARITERVVRCKSGVERLREQAANIE
jgi:uncharacterized protein (TIGR00255 family)